MTIAPVRPVAPPAPAPKAPVVPSLESLVVETPTLPVETPTLVVATPAPVEPVAAPAATTAEGVAITFVDYNPEGDDLAGEYVRIHNGSDAAVDLTGWVLSDKSSNHVYTFPAFTLAAGADVLLWTKSGENDATNLFWANRRPVWNNTGDTATLRDAAGNEISSYSF
ncbi:MAG: lamin tail domain-containing protein [Chloroflexaceae bacterium]|nr:lamin tail domain-containing protein [Chloroflexaceae bacterium]